MLSHFSTLRNCKTTLLVATTGDTGPAAVHAVSDVANPLLTILVHYPNGQISELQRRQLTTVQSPCVRIATFEGGGDDMDAPIKRIQTSQDVSASNKKVCGVNSYNIGRPLIQMVHFVSNVSCMAIKHTVFSVNTDSNLLSLSTYLGLDVSPSDGTTRRRTRQSRFVNFFLTCASLFVCA